MNTLRRLLGLLAIVALATPFAGPATHECVSKPMHATHAAAPATADQPDVTACADCESDKEPGPCEHGMPAPCSSMTSCASIAVAELTVAASGAHPPTLTVPAFARREPSSEPRAPETPPPRA